MQKIVTFLTGVAVAAGLAGMGYFIGDGLHSMRPNNRSVTVRGLSERQVLADSASISIAIENSGASPEEIFPKMIATQKQVADYLKQFGIKDDEIGFGDWKTSRTSASYLKDDPTLPLYEMSGSVWVSTPNIAAVANADKKMNDLRVATHGVAGSSSSSYGFNGLAPMRAEMIAAATKDARNAALQFAADSGSKVGAINTAQQGGFQILSGDGDEAESGKVGKIVRVVTTINYELKD